MATCDNEVVLYVNGKKVGQSADWTRPMSVDVAEAPEGRRQRDRRRGDQLARPQARQGDAASPGPTRPAFIAWVGGFDDGRPAWGVGTDATWLWAEDAPADWKTRADRRAAGSTPPSCPDAGRIYGGQVNLAAVVARAATGRRRHAPPRRRWPSTTP